MRRVVPSAPAAVKLSFNEAAGADPADAGCACRMRMRRPRRRFNEAAGADPADAEPGDIEVGPITPLQ